MLRVAVIGAGPAGLYVAGALVAQPDVSVDVFERLPTPFGLLRYGVAPDHLKMKSVSRALQRVLDNDRVRFFGNVHVGVDLTVDELRAGYHAVVYTFGAARDRRLGVPGEDLPGSMSATDFVMWYSGHPDVSEDLVDLSGVTSAVVVGMGNVAVDVSRILTKSVDALRETDIPDSVLGRLDASAVTDVHVLGRRGPAQAKFTTKELRELGELEGVDVIVDPGQLVLSEADQAEVDAHPAIARNVEVLRQWASRGTTGAPRRLHLHFWTKPAAAAGEGALTAVQVEPNRDDGHWTPRADGRYEISAQLLLRSVGYEGRALSGAPFDESSCTVPHRDGRVLREGVHAPGEYVAGWIGRGPVGVLGTNRSDGEAVVERILLDAPDLLGRELRGPSAEALLAQRSVATVDDVGWSAIDAAEIALGGAAGRARTKLATWHELLAAARVAAVDPV